MSSERSMVSFRPLDFVRESWRGDARLRVAFWYGGLASLCVTLTSFFAALICGMVFLGPIAIVFPVSPGRAFEIVAGTVFFTGLGVSAGWWLVSVWRCAPNSQRRLWFFIARGVVLCDAAATGLMFLL
jgi:hypothetical protein